MVFIGRTFKGGRLALTRAAERREGDGSLRQRNELVFVGDMRESATLPVLLGLLDPFLAGGDEIPPDVARAFQRIAAEKHHAHRLRGLYGNAIAGPKNQQPRPLIAIARYLDFAVYQVDGALFEVGVERHSNPLLRAQLGVEPRRNHSKR